MNNKIILLNGPPGCGKDSIGEALKRVLPKAQTFKFAKPIKDAIGALFDLTEQESKFYFETTNGKNHISTLFGEKRPRDWLISFSESFVKPFASHDFFGHLAARRLLKAFIEDGIKTAIFTDSGFSDESRYLINEFSGDLDIYLIRLHRFGCSFDGDSRSHIHLGGRVWEAEVHNTEGVMEEAVTSIFQFVTNNTHFPNKVDGLKSRS